MGAEAPRAPRGGWEERRAGLGRAVLLALALAAPALCLGQEAGLPAAELPGGALPGTGRVPGVAVPSDYTNYGVAAGVGATDDVNLSSTDRKSQGLAVANLLFDLVRTGSRLELNAAGNFSDIDYLEHAYSNQVLGRFDGVADMTLWQHHLKWLVRDDYGDSQINVLQGVVPRNLQRINVFSTGPDVTFEPTVSSFLELQGIYSRTTYQTSPFSGQSEMGSAEAGHRFSPSSSLSLVGRVQQERFDNKTVNVNYQIREYFGHYALKSARDTLDLQGGLTQTNDSGSWKSSPLLRLSLTRDISPFSSIRLSGGRDYRNATGSFANLESISGGIPIGAAAQTTANALHTYGDASWRFHRLRTTLGLFAGWSRDGYDRGSLYNSNRTDVGLNLGRHLTRRLSAHLMATVNRSRYGNQGFTDTFGTAGGALVYHASQWLVIYGRYDHQFRTTAGEPAKGFGYDENRVFLMVGYYPHSSGEGLPGSMMGGGGFGGMR